MDPRDTRNPFNQPDGQPPRAESGFPNPEAPYFREVQAILLEGQLSVDQSYILQMEKPTSDAMLFWVGGGSLYMH